MVLNYPDRAYDARGKYLSPIPKLCVFLCDNKKSAYLNLSLKYDSIIDLAADTIEHSFWCLANLIITFMISSKVRPVRYKGFCASHPMSASVLSVHCCHIKHNPIPSHDILHLIFGCVSERAVSWIMDYMDLAFISAYIAYSIICVIGGIHDGLTGVLCFSHVTRYRYNRHGESLTGACDRGSGGVDNFCCGYFAQRMSRIWSFLSITLIVLLAIHRVACVLLTDSSLGNR